MEKAFEGKKRKPDNDIIEIDTINKEREVKDHKNKRNNRGKNKGKENPTDENVDQVQDGIKKDWNVGGKNFDIKRDLKSEKFENYYRVQLAKYFENEGQFQLFIDKMREKLPCVFRINTANPFWKKFRDILTDENIVKNLSGGEDYGIKITQMLLTNSEYWKNLIFNINIPRFELKRNESLSVFHKLIQKSVDSGLMSRQEAVSMIPPILMNPSNTDKIFDMCAAPGSKTAQFLEVFYRNYDFLDPNSVNKDTGFVIANDNNWNRAFMMTHQLKRLNTAAMVVISHDAQFFPFLYDESNERILFDKILADVPCSSDAVLRKLPHRWRNWSPKDSFNLHKLQLSIIKRGVSLLKPGGTIVYSTCSLNPIENEAVVSEVMKSHEHELEILDMTELSINSHINFRRGLTTWKVFIDDKSDKSNKNLIEIKNKEDPLITTSLKDLIEDSYFPPDEHTANNIYKLQNCVRLFPHDSDTSGFFITVFKKKLANVEQLEKGHKDKKIHNSTKDISFVINSNTEIIKWIQDFYGFNANENSAQFPIDQLVTSSKIFKKINFVSKGVANLINSDKRNQLKLINIGVKLFSMNKQKNPEEDLDYCKYRICQDGLFYAIPFLTKRIFFRQEEFFINLLKNIHIPMVDLDDEEFKTQLKSVRYGCIVIVCVKNLPIQNHGFQSEYYIPYLKENYIDALCCQISNSRLSTMINKDHQHVFDLKFSIKR
jgi:16S rRNA C967 or C1407 C5-methylase (RsmB/RsmF family)